MLAQAAALTATHVFRRLINAQLWKQATRSRHC